MDEIPVRDIRPGDLLLHYSKGEISKLIRWVSDSNYSHVAMVYEVGWIKEAASGGVRRAKLDKRIEDPDGAFFRIDVGRPTRLDAIPPETLAALRSSADAMDGAKFALEQMFELGVIWALRNKMPPDTTTKRVLTWLFDTLIPSDPDRLLCSEFVYLAYLKAKTEPPGVLKPKIRATKRLPRKWEEVDWGQLFKEYTGAKGAPPELEKVLSALPADDVVTDGANEVDQAYQAALLRAREQIRAARGGAILETTNPDLVLPQDLADSPSFAMKGTAVP